jgi:hypothetical protein
MYRVCTIRLGKHTNEAYLHVSDALRSIHVESITQDHQAQHPCLLGVPSIRTSALEGKDPREWSDKRHSTGFTFGRPPRVARPSCYYQKQ